MTQTRSVRRGAAILALGLAAASGEAVAGGPWVPEKGDGWTQIGFSRKTAHTSWDDSGSAFANTGRFQNHDFRYLYLSGEVGIARRLAATYTITWLDGREGPTGHLHRNEGWSDAWLGLKYALRRGERPVSLGLTVRTPILYDMAGPYTLELYDDDGEFVGLSPEWRGILKHDVTLSGSTGGGIGRCAGWWSAEGGYTWREGAPADQLTAAAESGCRIFGNGTAIKIAALAVRSLGNDTARRPSDRFGSRPGFNFNDASMARAGVSFLVPLDRQGRLGLEVGYNLWLWGRSARQYEEPFLALWQRF